jgi:Tfp pilus assembly protein FimT
MPKSSSSHGFTLVELCGVMGILALVLSFAFSSLAQLFMTQERRIALDTLKNMITYGRHYAIAHQADLILCGAKNEKRLFSAQPKTLNELCTPDNWDAGVLLLQRHADHPETAHLLLSYPAPAYGTLIGRDFGPQGQFRISADGHVETNGSITYTAHWDARENRVLTTNKEGRLYVKLPY